MEDALISPEGFAILSGADLIAATADKPIYQHMTGTFQVGANGLVIDTKGIVWTDEVKEAYMFVMKLDEYNNIEGEPMIPTAVTIAEDTGYATVTIGDCLTEGMYVFVDYYVKRTAGAQQIEITPDKFGGYYYVEASTLFRREADGVDMPAEFIIPKAKVQSSFNFAMASSGDPSTFTFTLDAFPGYLKFDRSKQVLAAIQIIEDIEGEDTYVRGEGCDNQVTKQGE